MYVLMEYKIIKNDGKGNKTSSPVRVIDSSDTIEKFLKMMPGHTTFDILGYCNIGRVYRGSQKMLLNLDKMGPLNSKGSLRILRMVREKALNDVLSI